MLLPGSLALAFGAGLILLVVVRRHPLARGDAGGAMNLFARLVPLIGALIVMGGSLMLHRDVLLALRTFGAAAAAIGSATLALTWTSGGSDDHDEPVVFAGGMTAPDFGALAFIIGIGLLAFALIL
jgi:hypothetical protein